MLAVGVAPPVFVAHKTHGLVGFVRNQLVGAVGLGGLHGGVVGGGPGVAGRLQAGVVHVNVHDPVAGQVVQQVEALQGLAQHQGDGVFVVLQDADGFPGHHIIGLLVGHVVAQLLPGLVAPGVGVGEHEQSRQGLVGHGHEAVLVSHSGQDIPAVLAGDVASALVISQGVGAAHPGIGLLQAQEAGIAVGGGVGAVLALHQVSDGIGHGLAVGGVGILDGVAALGVRFGARDAEVAGVVVGGAVVDQLGIQQALEGLHIGVRIDGGAIFPGAGGIQLDGVGVAGGGGLGNIEFRMLSLDLLGHVHGLRSGHFGHDLVASVGLLALHGVQLVVEHEGVQTGAQEVCGIRVILGLIGVGIPVGGQGRHRILVDIGFSSAFCHGQARQRHCQNQDESQNLLHGRFLLERFSHRKDAFLIL